LASPRLASPRLASPRLASPRLAWPGLAWPGLASPRLADRSASSSLLESLGMVGGDHSGSMPRPDRPVSAERSGPRRAEPADRPRRPQVYSRRGPRGQPGVFAPTRRGEL